LRQSISQRIAGLELPAESRAMLRALTVGDRSGLDHGLWSLFQSLGINHLLVISGLHIGMVAIPGWLFGGLLQRLLWSFGSFRHAAMLAPACAIAAGLAYAALAGFSLSTLRAVAMLAGVSLARLAGRHSGAANGLLLAAALLLFGNPLLALGSGFWLSFGAVAMLLALSTLRPERGSIGRRVIGSHLFMSLAMLPLAGWWFGGASLISAPVNAVLVPLVGLVVVPLALGGTLLSALGSGLDAALWSWAIWPLQFCLELARAALDEGGSGVYLRFAPGPLTAALSALALLLLLPRGGPGLALPGCALALPILLSGLRIADDDPALRVTVLDVGQGTAVLLRQGREALLYDTGGGDPAGINAAGSVILPYLRSLGVRRLNEVVVSHPDADHSAGFGSIYRSMEIGAVLFGGGVAPVTGALPCRAGRSWRWPGGVRFRVLSPAREPGLSSNDGSCVLQVSFAGYRLLLPGDVGRGREGELVRYWGRALRSDWLLVGHHGSATSSSHAWLKTVRPAVAVLSRGRGNRFGHPHPGVERRLAQYGAVVEDTASGGALEFRIAEEGVTLRRRRDAVRRFWM
jgi:competence protein ComEC